MPVDKDLTQLTAETSPALTALLYLLQNGLDRSVTPDLLLALTKDSHLQLTDITTNNASTTKHGFLKKLSGTATQFINGVGDWATPSGSSVPYLQYREEQAQNTAGGTFTSGAWRTRVLNTEVSDTEGHGTLASNQITLAAGTYRIYATAPALTCDRHQARLQNITDASTVLVGTSELASSAAGITSRSVVAGVFTIAASKAFEIQHQCQTTAATLGFGPAGNFTTEVYTVVELWKTA